MPPETRCRLSADTPCLPNLQLSPSSLLFGPIAPSRPATDG